MESLKKLDKFPLRKYLKLRYGLEEFPVHGGLFYKEVVELLETVRDYYERGRGQNERFDFEGLNAWGTGTEDKAE